MGDKNIQKKSPKTSKKDKIAEGKRKATESAKKNAEPATTTASLPEPNAPLTQTQVKAGETGASKLMRCECKHEYQDKRYGMGMRVHTPKKTAGWRCTVCGKDR
jgi:hypothetical protein